MKKSLASLGIIVLVVLSACSQTPEVAPEPVLPGATLGTTVVDPPANLPPEKVEEAPEEVKEELVCAPVQDLPQKALDRLNEPPIELETPSPYKTGGTVVSARQMKVTSSYGKSFAYLEELKLSGGETLWLGSPWDLTVPESFRLIVLTRDPTINLFGANGDAYNLAFWGTGLENSVLVKESSEIVTTYSPCFS